MYRRQSLGYGDLDSQACKLGDQTFGFRVALKIAESRRIIRALDTPLTITLVNPVYKEIGRIQRREEHPHGEDSIRYKLKVLRELESLNPNLVARFVVVDDECPSQSGEFADEILKEFAEEHASGKYRTLYLGRAIDDGDPAIPPNLTHKNGTNRSVKGGALLFGMRKTIDDSVDGLQQHEVPVVSLAVSHQITGMLAERLVERGSLLVQGDELDQLTRHRATGDHAIDGLVVLAVGHPWCDGQEQDDR